MSISIDQLQAGLEPLSDLSIGEFQATLRDVVLELDDELVFNRVGRLMCVWLKSPFAQSFPYDPSIPTNWAKSFRCWEIHGPVSSAMIPENAPQRQLLDLFAEEWQRPVEYLAEYNIFHSICKRLRPLVCGEWKALENAEKIAKDVRKGGQDITLLTTNQVLGAASVSMATYLVQTIPWLTTSHMPVVAGCTLLGVCIGQRALCRFLTNFEASYDKNRDRFAQEEFPKCGSTETNDGKPCRNRVRGEGMLCWIHAG